MQSSSIQPYNKKIRFQKQEKGLFDPVFTAGFLMKACERERAKKKMPMTMIICLNPEICSRMIRTPECRTR
ncbi:hypothetical protein VTL71DRAFT_4032 [Oculimacula yallundae]|uniref:Uncharacterized protein n=1 Tax=Oculimacula yallundae TaxID=86028 RepID=A0ABR4C5W3_9HELO